MDIVCSNLTEIAMNNYVSTWENMVSSDTGSTKIGGNKLRTYRMVKTEFKTEEYVKCIWVDNRGLLLQDLDVEQLPYV